MNTGIKKRTSSGNFSFYNISIRRRLPLLITSLLLLVIISFSVTSYNSLKTISLESGKGRLHGLVTEFSSLFKQSVDAFTGSVNNVANNNVIKNYIKSGSSLNKKNAEEELDKLSSKIDTLTLLVELRNKDKERILTSQFYKQDIEPDQEFLNKYLIPNKNTVSKFYKTGRHIYWAASSPVLDAGKTIGYVIKWRLVLASPAVTSQLSKLLGSNAALYLGNNDGKIWYNLYNLVSNPPVNVLGNKKVLEYSRPKGMPVIAETMEIPGTEWLILIELSKDKILAPSNQFLGKILMVSLLLIIAGLILAMLMSRSITKPLDILTKASTNIASGDYSTFVQIMQHDELGKLANTFNFMITRIKESQKHLQSSLNEKEILLKEIHHRVKNNLQIISSLLNLQTIYLKEEESIQAIESSKNRIKSMAIVHEKLYQTASFIRINLKDYVEELIKHLAESFSTETKHISYKLEIIETFVNIDVATSLGLIITELISNSVKHAFPNNNNGFNEIFINGFPVSENYFKLIYKDNGQGFPENYDINDSASLGLQLVSGLVDQIKGKMEIKNSMGTQFEITFNLNDKSNSSAEVESLIKLAG